MKKRLKLFFLFLICVFLFSKDFYKLSKYQILEYKLNKKIRKLKEENESMKKEIEMLKVENFPYIEYLIRKNLNYALPGEIEFHFDISSP